MEELYPSALGPVLSVCSSLHHGVQQQMQHALRTGANKLPIINQVAQVAPAGGCLA